MKSKKGNGKEGETGSEQTGLSDLEVQKLLSTILSENGNNPISLFAFGEHIDWQQRENLISVEELAKFVLLQMQVGYTFRVDINKLYQQIETDSDTDLPIRDPSAWEVQVITQGEQLIENVLTVLRQAQYDFTHVSEFFKYMITCFEIEIQVRFIPKPRKLTFAGLRHLETYELDPKKCREWYGSLEEASSLGAAR